MTIYDTLPGKYDAACTAAREATKAVGCVLIVIEGEAGSGFSVQTRQPELIGNLPALLRLLAIRVEIENAERSKRTGH